MLFKQWGTRLLIPSSGDSYTHEHVRAYTINILKIRLQSTSRVFDAKKIPTPHLAQSFYIVSKI